MAVTYVSRIRKNPLIKNAAGKYYPAVSYISEINVSKLAQEISESTTLTPTEVIGVIQSFLTSIPRYMLLGYKVRLDSFGILKLGFTGTVGHEKEEDVSANDIGGLRILFHPDKMLMHRLENPEFVRRDQKKKDAADTDGNNPAEASAQEGSGGTGNESGQPDGFTS